MARANTLAVSRKQVAAIVAATFPEYRGRKIRLVAEDSLLVHELNWSGGARNQYRGCTLTGERTGDLDRYNACAPWNNGAEGQTTRIPLGAVVVRHSFFQGQDCGLTISVNPGDMPRLLPAA